jgi:hypothetical protein
MHFLWQEIVCVYERVGEEAVRPFGRLFRLQVPGGWLVSREKSGTDLLFIADAEHSWQPSDAERRCIAEDYCGI